MPDIIVHSGEVSKKIVERLSVVILKYGSALLVDDTVVDTSSTMPKDIRGNDRPYLEIRGIKGEEQFDELRSILQEHRDEIHPGIESEWLDLLLFIDENGVEHGPGLKETEEPEEDDSESQQDNHLSNSSKVSW